MTEERNEWEQSAATVLVDSVKLGPDVLGT